MAVAIAASAGQQQIRATSATSYTAAAGSDRLLVVLVGMEAASAVITGVDFSTTEMTAAFTVYKANNCSVACYYLLDADIPTGLQTITVNYTGIPAWTTDIWTGQIYTLTGVDQITPTSANDTSDQAAATTWSSSNITSVTDGILLSIATTNSAIDGLSSITTGSWTTNSLDINAGGGTANTGHKLITSGASEGVTWDWNALSETGALALVSFSPSVAGGTNESILIPTGPLR